jgi:hypothetical protein
MRPARAAGLLAAPAAGSLRPLSPGLRPRLPAGPRASPRSARRAGQAGLDRPAGRRHQRRRCRGAAAAAAAAAVAAAAGAAAAAWAGSLVASHRLEERPRRARLQQGCRPQERASGQLVALPGLQAHRRPAAQLEPRRRRRRAPARPASLPPQAHPQQGLRMRHWLAGRRGRRPRRR